MLASSILTQGQGQTLHLVMRGAVGEVFPVHQRTPDDNVLILHLYITCLCQNETLGDSLYKHVFIQCSYIIMLKKFFFLIYL